MLQIRPNEPIFYNGYETLMLECLYSFIVGERGNGKGFFAKTWGVECAVGSIEGRQVYYYDEYGNEVPVEGVRRAIEEGRVSQFGYVRRRSVVMDESAPKFFDNIKHQWPEHNFTYKGGVFYCDDRIIGYALPLSTFANMNSVDFPFIDYIIYDEFIVDEEKGEKPLRHEVHKFKELYETVARPATRGYRVPVLFIANRVSDINDFFVAWNLETPNNKKGWRIFHGDMLVLLTQTVEFRRMKMQTPFYQMLQKAGDEQYISYAVNNEALRDTNDFIRKPPSDAVYRFTIDFVDLSVGVYYSAKENIYYISNRVDGKFKLRFTTESSLHGENCSYIKRRGSNSIFMRFLIYLENDLVWYRNKETKYVTLRNLSHLR